MATRAAATLMATPSPARMTRGGAQRVATRPQPTRPISPAPCATASAVPASGRLQPRPVTAKLTRKPFRQSCMAEKAQTAMASRRSAGSPATRSSARFSVPRPAGRGAARSSPS
nr:hypothetical protein [Azospirillum argentinense]